MTKVEQARSDSPFPTAPMRRTLLLAIAAFAIALLPAAYLLIWELFPGTLLGNMILGIQFSATVAIALTVAAAAFAIGAAAWATSLLCRSGPADLAITQYAAFFMTVTLGAIGLGLGIGFTLFLAGWRF